MTRMLYFFLPVVFLASCTINEPSLPKWDTSWEIHLKGDVVQMSELLKNSEEIYDSTDAVTGEQTYFINFSDTSESKEIDQQDLSMQGDEQHFSYTLGVFEVTQPDPKTDEGLSFGEIFSDYNPTPGSQIPPINPRILEPDPRDLVFENFSLLEIESATFTVIFHNNLILGIDEGMQITVFDHTRLNDADGGLIGEINFAEAIPAGNTLESNALNLAGKTISNEITLRYRIPLSGTDSMMTLTQEDIDSDFYTEVVISPVRVNRALAKIPEQRIIRNNSAPVNADDHAISFAEINKGSLHLQIGNNLSTGSVVNIDLPNFVDKSNKILTRSEFVNANTVKNIQINLDGYNLQNEKQNGTYVDSIYYNVSSVTERTTEDVWLSEDDSVTVHVSMDSLYFNSIQGNINRTQIAFEPVRKDDFFDQSGLEGSFKLPELVLILNFHNEVDLDLNVDFNVTGYHRDAYSGIITDSVTVSVNQPVSRSGQTLMLDKHSSSPSIVDLMSIMPTEMIVTGNAYIEGEGSIAKGDKVWLDYIVDSPFTLQIDEPMLYTADKQALNDKESDSKKRQDISENFTEIEIVLLSDNGLPLASDIKFFMSTDSSTLFDESPYDSTEKFIAETYVSAASINADGFVNKTVKEENLIHLTQQQITLFEQSPLYYGYKVAIEPTSKPVRFRTNDQLRFDAVLKFNSIIDPNKE